MRFFLVALSLFVQFGLLDHRYRYPLLATTHFALAIIFTSLSSLYPSLLPMTPNPKLQIAQIRGIFFVALYNMTIFPMSLRCQAQARKCDTANNYSASAHL